MGEAKADITIDRYLTYLDKEMTIMGILSGFCMAALALAINQLAGKDSSRMVSLTAAGPVSLTFALIMLLLASLSFYRQRSLLAWFYGQLSLQDSGYPTHKSLHDWLRDADAWDTWMNYQRGFWLLVGTFCELGLAIGAWQRSLIPKCSSAMLDRWGGGTIAVAIVAAIVIQMRILHKWSYAEDPYKNFRDSPFSIFLSNRSKK
jgi:hypothetical protein